MAMRSVWRLFGRSGLRVFLMSFLAAGLAALLWMGWDLYGMPGSSGEPGTDMEEAGAIGTERPVIHARSLRVAQGEELIVPSLATATDVDGTKLDASLQFMDAKGEPLGHMFDTSRPGCYPVTLSVRSRCLGIKVKKTILILVDGRA